MRITAIESQRHQIERVNVHVDGAYHLALSRELLYRAGLHVGDEVTEARLEALIREDLGWQAREAALNLLSYRARTARELGQRLRQKDFPAEVAEACVLEMVERGLVDDSAFAETFVRDRVRHRPRGARRLVQELRVKGVDADTASDAIAEVMRDAETSEIDLARDAVRKWSRRPGEDAQRARRRLHGFLARRGFGGETIRLLLDELANSGDEEMAE